MHTIPKEFLRASAVALALSLAINAGVAGAETVPGSPGDEGCEAGRSGDCDTDDTPAPQYGIGAMFVGPIGFLGLHTHYYPLDQVALDGGASALPGLASAFVGTRIRPIALGPLRPYVGAALSGFVACGATEDGGDCGAFAAWAPRAGIDVEFVSRRWIAGVEVELMNTFGGEEFMNRGSGRWVPWGGVYFARQY